MGSVPVQLYVYDLSGGVARALSASLLGIQIDAIYHTSVVVRGIEHYFGGGINVAPAGTTPFGHPIQVVDLGTTFLEEDIIEGLLIELSSRFTPEAYSLFSNNCNTFSNELAQLLTGNSIPEHIVALPETVLSTPFGQMLRPMLAGLEQQMKNMREQAFTPQHYHETEASVAGAAHGQTSNGTVGISGEAGGSGSVTTQNGVPLATTSVGAGVAAMDEAEEGPAVVAAEKELEAAVAECALVDMKQRLEELDLKEGRATPLQQLGEEGAARLAAETAVKNELDKIITGSAVHAGENGSNGASGAAVGGVGGDIDIKEAEALAVEHVVASGKVKAPSSPRAPHRHSETFSQ
jgi:desumoylating isopeptidase 1